MSKQRKQLKFEILLERYFSNFHRILLTNLLFFVPFSIVTLAMYLINNSLLDSISIPVLLLSLILLFPFYSGVVIVCRNIARGDEQVPVLSTFFKGIKNNFIKFLIYGIVLSLSAVFSYYSVTLYTVLLAKSWVFYVILFVCILVVLAVFFTALYVPVMTVTFDLSIINTIKNSFLMSFGELKNNFLATLSLAVVFAIIFTITMFCKSVVVLVIILLALSALILPATCQFVVSFFVYDDMYNVICNKDKVISDIDTAIKNKTQEDSIKIEKTDDFSDIDISTIKNCDEYIFYNGKMVKQSYIYNKIMEQQSNSTDNKEV